MEYGNLATTEVYANAIILHRFVQRKPIIFDHITGHLASLICVGTPFKWFVWFDGIKERSRKQWPQKKNMLKRLYLDH